MRVFALQLSSQEPGASKQSADLLMLLPAGVDTVPAEAANSGLGREGGRERAQQSLHVAGVL